MKIALITLFPDMLNGLTQYGISSRAVANELLEIQCFNPREFTKDKHRTVDDRPYGGGPGMLMMCQPLAGAVSAAKNWINTDSKVVYMSPQGEQFVHETAKTVAEKNQNLVLVAGRYEGVDERFIEQYVDLEWTIGDYVLSGGELPSMVVIDAIIRQIPGALGHECSAETDSFVEGLLDFPQYTRPESFMGRKVPDVLLSGNHQEIAKWRLKQAKQRTKDRRPDLIQAKSDND